MTDEQRFLIEVHPGRPCGEWPDGSFCWQENEYHYVAPRIPPLAEPEPPNWAGWQDLGYTTEEPQ